jgi:hypothetical protein
MKNFWFTLLLIPTLALSDSWVGKVYKSPTCGCCNAWIEHMREAGYELDGHNTEALNSVKAQLGIPATAQSCHSAIINQYIFEGHVPAQVVSRFFAAPEPNALGLSVPGMPVGSPGMEMGARHDDYTVQLIMLDGSMLPYAEVSRDSINYRD